MASGPQHYEKAEEILREIEEGTYPAATAALFIEVARVHAMLANVAAKARAHGNIDFHEWARVSAQD